jgi:hypothetical protein
MCAACTDGLREQERRYVNEHSVLDPSDFVWAVEIIRTIRESRPRVPASVEAPLRLRHRARRGAVSV